MKNGTISHELIIWLFKFSSYCSNSQQHWQHFCQEWKYQKNMQADPKAVSNFAGLKMGTKFRLKREWQRTSRLKLNAFCRYIIYIPIRAGVADYSHHIDLSPPNLKNDPPGLVWDGSLYLLCSIVSLSIQ